MKQVPQHPRSFLQFCHVWRQGAVLMGSSLRGAVNKEYTPVKDAQDGYSFVYLFGWQEVAVKGQDVVYKDVIEPLESVSVSITKTDKEKVSEFGPAAEARARPLWCQLLTLCDGRTSPSPTCSQIEGSSRQLPVGAT